LVAKGCNGNIKGRVILELRPYRQFLPETNMSMLAAMKSNSRAIAMGGLLAAALATSGCTRLRTHQGYVGDEVLINAVAAGIDNKQSVQDTLGRPTFAGQFDANDWYYFSRDSRQLAFSSPKAKAQNLIHIRFDAAGNVTSVEKTGMAAIASVNIEGDKTPTLGRHSSFFKDLFGGIGSVGSPVGGGGGGGDGGQ
jgi:outer membrane protein assembly factor BamE (lipoprotein component of BamABCDE complex)